MNEFTFIRHGDVDWLTLNLNATGIKAAKIFAYNFDFSNIEKIIVSPVPRTIQTAEIIKNITGKDYETKEFLKPWMANKNSPDMLTNDNDYWDAYTEFVECNGSPSKLVPYETKSDIKKRLLCGLEKYKENSVLLITHSIVISCLTETQISSIKPCTPVRSYYSVIANSD